MRVEWVPLKRVANFMFGSAVDPYVTDGYLMALPDEDGVGWRAYGVRGRDMRVYAEDGEIISIACSDECCLKGRNLIGLPIEDAIEVIGTPPSSEPEQQWIIHERQTIYYFDEMEAMLWVHRGVVVSITCSHTTE